MIEREGPDLSIAMQEATKNQGYKTRAPEGMSILAFLGISPFQRLLIPLTRNNHIKRKQMVKLFLG